MMETVSTEIVVHHRHLLRLKLCNNGARPWFAAKGLSWQRFIEDGYPISVIRATGDAFAHRVADLAESEARGE